MLERLKHRETEDIEQRLKRKRKKFTAILAASSVFIIGTTYESGFLFFPTPVKFVSESYKQLTDPRNGNAYLDTGDFFSKNGKYEWVHRAGNALDRIDEAVKENQNKTARLVLDMDATDINEELYGEHGIILHKKIAGLNFNLVIDPNEVDLETKLPPTFQELIKHIASLSTPQKPIGVNIELKHGSFKEEALTKLIDILLEYQVPAIIQPDQQGSRERLETIRRIYDERKDIFISA